MHRATQANSSIRGHTSGGSRSVVEKVDDSSLMQSMSGNFMKNESRSGVEAPQNYGFTSVCMPADKDESGKITGGPETFISFMGGSRGLPVAGNMDDRRHRLCDLSPGDSAMYRTKDDDQQFHLTKDGGFWSAPEGKTVRMQLVPQGSAKRQPKQQKGKESGAGLGDPGGGGDAGGAGGEPTVMATASGGGGGGSGSGSSTGQQGQQNKPTGQKAVADAGKDSIYHVEVKKDLTSSGGNRVQMKLSDKKGYVDAVSKSVYLGFPKGEAPFAKVLTTKGPAKNVWGRIG
jgi:Bacteriophage Mu Gp45 spike protein